MVHDLSEAAVLFAFFCSAQVPLSLGWFWPWRRSALGRSYVFMDIIVAMSLMLPALSFLFGLHVLTDKFFAYYYIVTISLVGIATLYREYCVIRVQSEVVSEIERKKTEAHDAPEEKAQEMS